MKAMVLIALMAALGFLTANAQKTVVSQKNEKVYDLAQSLHSGVGVEVVERLWQESGYID